MKSFGITLLRVTFEIACLFRSLGTVFPLRQRVTTDRSTPTMSAKAASLILFLRRNTSSFIVNYVHIMHVHVKHIVHDAPWTGISSEFNLAPCPPCRNQSSPYAAISSGNGVSIAATRKNRPPR